MLAAKAGQYAAMPGETHSERLHGLLGGRWRRLS